MKQHFTLFFFLVEIGLLNGLGISTVQAQAPTVVSRQPARHAPAAPRTGPITVQFSQAITVASAARLRVYGSQGRGLRPGTLSGGGTTTLSFAPTQLFTPGERVSVSIPSTLTNAAGAGVSRQVYEFTAATGGTGRGFFSDTTETVRTSSRDQLLGDIDGDGDLDLLTASGLYGMFSYLNDGQGHFTPYFNTVVGQTPSGATLADMNQDGYLDLLAGDADNATVAIAMNTGTGQFGIPPFAGQYVNVGARPVSIATGDVDGDGDLDFASANNAASTVTIGFNGGAAATTPYSIISVATVSVGQQPTTVQLADVDNDGDLDLLTSNGTGNSVSIRLNNGTGTFSGTTSVTVGRAPADLGLGDLDNDGDLDFLTANATDGTVSVRLNNGTGTFSGTTTIALPLGSTPTGLRVGDVDADGDLDALVAQGAGGQVITLVNNGIGSLAVQYGALELKAVYGSPVSLGVTMGDVDADGDLDVVTADQQRGVVLVGHNGGAPVVAPPTLTAILPGAGPVGALGIRLAGTNLSSTTAVFFNGTSASFVVNSNVQLTATVPAGASTGPVSVTTVGGGATSTQSFIVTAGPVPPVLVTSTVPVLNDNAASPTGPIQATFASPIDNLSVPALRVFGSQRRGRQLGAVSGGGTNTLTLTPSPAFAPGERVLLSLPAGLTSTSGGSVKPQVVEFRAATGGTGEGLFDAAGSTSVAASATSSVHSADLDSDGDIDLVSSSYASGQVALRLNNGSGTFSISTGTLPTLPGGILDVAPVDADGDGDLDLLVVENSSATQPVSRLHVWFNDGQARFTAGVPLPTPTGVAMLRVGDMDADGDLDILFRDGGNNSVRVAFNNGSGSFILGASTNASNFTQLRVADLDADGDLDVLGLDYTNSARLIVLLNDGQGGLTLQPAIPIVLSVGMKDLAVGDLTGDGLPDAVVVAYDYNNSSAPGLLAVWPGLGNGQFGLRSQPVAVGSYPQAVTLADVNADGQLDVLTLAANSVSPAQLTVWLGDGRGGLRQPDTQQLSTANDELRIVEAGDFDGDGDLDIAFSNMSQSTLAVRFNHGRPGPTLTALAPSSGPVGTRVVLTGTNLTSARQVTFGGVVATGLQVLSATQCAAIVPAGAATGPVTVSTPNGTATSSSPFTVVVPIALLSRSPARHAISAPTTSEVRLHFGQSLPASAAGDLVVRGDLRQGRRLGTASGAGTTDRAFTPALAFAPGERVQVTLPVATGPAAGSPLAQVYDFTAATSGPGRGNLRWANYGNFNGGIVADVNEDGAPDLLTNEASTNRMLLLFNNGQGKLGATTAILPFAQVEDMQLADLDNDGHLDLLTAEFVRSRGTRPINRVVWRAGTGTGAFGTAQLLHYINGQGQKLTVGDLNGDGLLDVTALIVGADSVLVSLNRSTGGFQRQADVASAPGAIALRLADSNNDGLLDLFTGGTSAQQVYQSFGGGTGNFIAQSPILLPKSVASLELGDVDADGNLDLLVGMPVSSQGSLQVLHGNGQGAFSSAQWLALGDLPGYIRLADFDADGDLDLLSGNLIYYQGVQLSFNNGLGSFSSATTTNGNMVPRQLAVADFNLDGSLDLAIGGDSLISASNFSKKSGLFMHFNRPPAPTITSFTPTSGNVSTVVTLTGTALGPVTNVTVGGVPVVFTVVSPTQLTLTIAANTPPGAIVVSSPYGTATSAGIFTLPAPTISSFTPSTGGARRLVTLTGSNLLGATAVRFNGVLTTGFQVLSGSQLSVLVPVGTTSGLISVTTPSGTGTSNTAFTFAAAANGFTPGRNAQNVAPNANLSLDFSQPVSAANAAGMRVFGDARQGRRAGMLTGGGTGQLTFDPALDFAPGEQVSVSFPTAVLGMQGTASPKQVYQFRAAVGGTGRGTFGGSLTTAVNYYVTRLQLGDMDGDGDLDEVALIDAGTDALAISFNNGSGIYAAPVYTPITAAQGWLRLADVDADGDLDVVSMNSFAVLGVWLNNGAGQLSAPQTLQLPGSVGNGDVVDIGDIDGDGDLDLLMGDQVYMQFIPLLNDGTAHFTMAAAQAANSNEIGISLADLDLDGDLDVVYTTSVATRSYALAVRLNDGDGHFTGTYSFPLTYEPSALQLGDMDGDGHLDIVLTDKQLFSTGGYQAGITTLHNDGIGRFSISARRLLYAPLVEANDLKLGDIDADGDLDVLTLGNDLNAVPYTNQAIRLFLNNGQGILTTVTPIAYTSPALFNDVALGDVDGDGDLDLAHLTRISSATEGISIRLNGPTVPVPLGNAAASPLAALITLYPNPTRQQFTIGFPANLLLQTGKLTLINTVGQVVQEQAVPALPAGGQLPVTISSLAEGLYLVRLLVDNNQLLVGRLMVK